MSTTNSNIRIEDVCSKSELRVIKLMIQGYSSKEIAVQLFNAVSTIQTHIKRAMRKAKVRNNVELAVKYVLQN